MPRRKTKKEKVKAWVVAVNMGYGHLRPAHSLRHLAIGDKLISANNYRGIPKQDKEIWRKSREFYEFISRFKRVPIVGEHAFRLYDKLQSIPKFYPRRDLSKPNIQLNQIYRYIKKEQWGKHLIDFLSKQHKQDHPPFVTTFFATAFMADEHKYPGDIYCIATDADISRSWAPLGPVKSQINYLASNLRVKERLLQYGVSENKIYHTGFPLPLANIGKTAKASVLKRDLGRRLFNLDPKKKYLTQYKDSTIKQLGRNNIISKKHHPLTITFAVGGAGAQRDIGATILHSLAEKIKSRQVRMILIAGIHNDVRSYFYKQAVDAGLRKMVGSYVQIVHAPNKHDYFSSFDKALHQTDILWTKPSELSFYGALGIPIIMSPPIGSQEHFNRRWLDTLGAGIDQEDPQHTHEWLFDWIDSGWLAEAAMQGFLEMPRFGTINIENVLAHRPHEVKHPDIILQY